MTVITFPQLEMPIQQAPLRRFEVSRDLSQAADLIELCFRESLDEDGIRYIEHLRRSARQAGMWSWAGSMAEKAGLPLQGFVWEENGRLVGNLSLIPARRGEAKILLIANVAVHPDFRRRGIARRLTQAAMAESQRRKSAAIWLHVRSGNSAAETLYRNMGFQERARRTTWQATAGTGAVHSGGDFSIRSRRAADWNLQAKWLNESHPAELAWYLPLDLRRFQPGLQSAFHQFFSGRSVRHWAARREEELLGIVTRESGTSSSDRLWLAAPLAAETAAVESLLNAAHRQTAAERQLQLEVPDQVDAQPLRSAGFQPKNSLIWMRYP